MAGESLDPRLAFEVSVAMIEVQEYVEKHSLILLCQADQIGMIIGRAVCVVWWIAVAVAEVHLMHVS